MQPTSVEVYLASAPTLLCSRQRLMIQGSPKSAVSCQQSACQSMVRRVAVGGGRPTIANWSRSVYFSFVGPNRRRRFRLVAEGGGATGAQRRSDRVGAGAEPRAGHGAEDGISRRSSHGGEGSVLRLNPTHGGEGSVLRLNPTTCLFERKAACFYFRATTGGTLI